MITKTIVFPISLWCIFYALVAQPEYPQKMVITKPLANLRAQPEINCATLPAGSTDNPLQITQLLLGEHIIAHEEFIDAAEKKWLRVNTLQQEYFYAPLLWHGYPGWIQADDAIPVQDFPTYNLVVKSYTAYLYDEQMARIQTLSIGTRLLGVKYSDALYKLTLPDNSTAFIKTKDVYFIDETIQESAETLRSSIIESTQKFLNNWYCWGGRSAQCADFELSSVDCSALINLSFLAHGLQLPRMSHEQFLRATPIQCCKDLEPGDLIFFSSIKKQSTRMDHVMMYIGNNLLIESTAASCMLTRITSFDQRMGHPCNGLLFNGDIVIDGDDSYRVYFGTFFNNKELLQSLRNDALKNVYDADYLYKKSITTDKNYLRYH